MLFLLFQLNRTSGPKGHKMTSYVPGINPGPTPRLIQALEFLDNHRRL
jgi:hypothetical protein